jgi:hypothetical protein
MLRAAPCYFESAYECNHLVFVQTIAIDSIPRVALENRSRFSKHSIASEHSHSLFLSKQEHECSRLTRGWKHDWRANTQPNCHPLMQVWWSLVIVQRTTPLTIDLLSIVISSLHHQVHSTRIKRGSKTA